MVLAFCRRGSVIPICLYLLVGRYMNMNMNMNMKEQIRGLRNESSKTKRTGLFLFQRITAAFPLPLIIIYKIKAPTFLPNLFAFDPLPKVSPFFLGKDIDIYFFISFMIVIVVSIFGLLRLFQEMKDYFLSTESPINNFSWLVFLSFIGLALALQTPIGIAYCDAIQPQPFSPPPGPVQLPEEVVAPELPEEVVAPPVVIPQLPEPLIPDDTRRGLLFTRYATLNIGGDEDLRRMVSIIDSQFIVERSVEAALVEDGYTPDSILSRYRDIRGFLHAPEGRLFNPRTYNSYVTQIMEHGTRESVPYRRIMRAILNNDVVLDHHNDIPLD